MISRRQWMHDVVAGSAAALVGPAVAATYGTTLTGWRGQAIERLE